MCAPAARSPACPSPTDLRCHDFWQHLGTQIFNNKLAIFREGSVGLTTPNLVLYSASAPARGSASAGSLFEVFKEDDESICVRLGEHGVYNTGMDVF